MINWMAGFELRVDRRIRTLTPLSCAASSGPKASPLKKEELRRTAEIGSNYMRSEGTRESRAGVVICYALTFGRNKLVQLQQLRDRNSCESMHRDDHLFRNGVSYSPRVNASPRNLLTALFRQLACELRDASARRDDLRDAKALP